MSHSGDSKQHRANIESREAVMRLELPEHGAIVLLRPQRPPIWRCCGAHDLLLIVVVVDFGAKPKLRFSKSALILSKSSLDTYVLYCCLFGYV